MKARAFSFTASLGRIFHALLLSIVAGCGGGTEEPRRQDEPPIYDLAPKSVGAGGVWVVMGSSTAAGAGAPDGNGWVAMLQASLGSGIAQFQNIAKGGTVTYHGQSASSARVSGRPEPDPAVNIDQALSRKPVVLLIAYPTNDTALGYSTAETVNNIFAIRRAALSAGVAVIVMSTQPRALSNSQLNQLNEIDKALHEQVTACFVDVNQALAGADGRLAAEYDSGDGVHPSESGHRLIATKVRELIDRGECIRIHTN